MRLRKSTPVNSLRTPLCQWAFVAAIGLLCVFVVYRIQISNGFSVLGGDDFDSVISASILEHWHRVYSGEIWWTNVQYFYPHRDTIAQTDAYFLLSVPYEIFRLCGLDPLLAQEFSGIVFRFAGYIFFYLLCKKHLKLSYGSSVFGATFFITVAASSSYIYRLQMDSLAISPLLVIWILSAIDALRDGSTRLYLKWGCLASVLYAAWCLTCLYLAWFFAYFALISVLLYCLTSWAEARVICSNFVRQWKASLFVVIVGVAALLPVIYVFLAKAADVGVRSWADVNAHLITPWAVLMMRPGSVGAGLIGQVVNPFIRLTSDSGEYAQIGYSPLVVVALFAALFFRIRTDVGERGRVLDRYMKVTVLAIVLCTISIVTIKGHSLWWIAFTFIPGAKALNVASALLIFLSFPSAMVIAWLASRINLSGLPLVIWGLGFIALEVNTPYVNLNRMRELALLNVPKPPSYCHSFYVGPLPKQGSLNQATQWIEGVYPHNVAALYIAQVVGIPTINGFASFVPPDWNFAFPGRSDYESRVMAYVKAHKLHDVCRLDIERKSWSPAF